MSMIGNHALLRTRDGHEARVTNVELFFDLIYAFAVTQLSHRLVHDLSLIGVLETLILWFAVWLGWQYTCWVSNWFDPDAMPIRLLLFAVMAVGMVMAASLPQAFGERGLIFAGTYALIQVGRSLVVLMILGAKHALRANFQRILGWLTISAALWIAGGLNHGETRLMLWALAVACEYGSPMIGFRLPGLGRSYISDWRTAEGGHIAERCQSFVILALGESVLVTGATISDTEVWSAPKLIAAGVCFIGSVAMWWVYFNTGSRDGRLAITRAAEPGQMAGNFHYVHVILIGGIIVSAAADDLVIAHPDQRITVATAALLIAGPAIYLLGNALYKQIVYQRLPLSHLVGLALLAALVPVAFVTDLLMVGSLTTVVMIVVAVWESRSRRSGSRREQLAAHEG